MKTSYKFILLIIISCISSILIYYFVEKVTPIPYKENTIDTQYKLEQAFSNTSSYTIDNPNIILNPYGTSPLTALIIFETKDLTTPTVTINGKDDKTTITNTFSPSKKHTLPIYGLYPGTKNLVTITLNNKNYNFEIETEKLPDNFVLPTNIDAKKEYLNNELYFVTPSGNGYTAAYDINGDVRWYLNTTAIWEISRLNNGHLLLSTDRLVNPPYYTTGLVEMDLLGKVYFEYTIPGGYHHDYYEMKDGNILVASDNFKDGTVEDYIVEIDRNSGKIIKSWNLRDIIPTDQGLNENATESDWFHNNAIWYDEKTKSITLSGRHQDAVINIDYETGELNWIIGDNNGWSQEMQKYFFKPTNELEWQWSQHAVKILPNGTISIFDNGNNRSKNSKNGVSANDNYSRAVIFKINTNDMTIEQVWQYGKELGSTFYSPYISDFDYIDENHYLIHSGGISSKNGIPNNNAASINGYDKLNSITVEIKNNEEIFKMELPSNFYRAEKMSLYANDEFRFGKGSNLGSQDVTPTDSNAFVLLNKNADDEFYKKYDLSITKEYDRLNITGRFKKSDDVKIVLDNLFNKKSYDMVISKKPYTAMCVDVFNQEEEKNGIIVSKYINSKGLSGTYYIYIKINGKVYDLDKYVTF